MYLRITFTFPLVIRGSFTELQTKLEEQFTFVTGHTEPHDRHRTYITYIHISKHIYYIYIYLNTHTHHIYKTFDIHVKMGTALAVLLSIVDAHISLCRQSKSTWITMEASCTPLIQVWCIPNAQSSASLFSPVPETQSCTDYT